MKNFLIKHYIKRRFQKTSIWFKGLMDPDHHKNLKLDDTTDGRKKQILIRNPHNQPLLFLRNFY